MRIVIAITFITIQSIAFAQAPITYSLELSNIGHHELKVSIQFEEVESDTLVIKMPNASPGRYAMHNFVKNVYEEKAFDEVGNAIEIKKRTPHEWLLPTRNGFAIFTYTIYGNHADGTYLGIDSRKLHMNMPATFPYAPSLNERKIKLMIPAKEKWDVATQLMKENDSTWSAPDYYYFYDSPTMAGEIKWRRWEAFGQTIEIAMIHEGTEQELDSYTEWVKKVVNEEIKVFGELPTFDFGRYTFLMSYNPWVYGDAMEHRNSTVCTSKGSISKNAGNLINSISHEFFHAWNIERIRPRNLEPFNFDQPNMSDALWFGEGFTNHYDGLILARAGIISPEAYIKDLAGTLNLVLFSPAREFRGPVEMSEFATFTDAGSANDETNYGNNFVSYYSYGHIIGLGLDLTLRSQYNKSLDDYMKLVWLLFGKSETPYSLDDLEQLLGELTKDQSFAHNFFKKQIYGTDLPDFEKLFEEFGIKMSLRNPNSPYFNNPRIDKGIIKSSLIRGTALYDAGVEKGDRIISVNGFDIETTSDLNRVINRMEVGKIYNITYEQLGQRIESSFLTRQDPRITLSYLAEKDLKKSVIKKRKEWLGIE